MLLSHGNNHYEESRIDCKGMRWRRWHHCTLRSYASIDEDKMCQGKKWAADRLIRHAT